MFSNMSTHNLLPICATLVAAYYIVLILASRKKTVQHTQPVPANSAGISGNLSMTAPTLMGKITPPSQPVIEIDQEWRQETWGQVEMLDDDDAVLVKAAETAVEEIQGVIRHIASNPPNPEEVLSKVGQVVCSYRIFLNTEYYDPINQFVADTVEKDCQIKLTESQLQALWNDRVG